MATHADIALTRMCSKLLVLCKGSNRESTINILKYLSTDNGTEVGGRVRNQNQFTDLDRSKGLSVSCDQAVVNVTV